MNPPHVVGDPVARVVGHGRAAQRVDGDVLAERPAVELEVGDVACASAACDAGARDIRNSFKDVELLGCE